MKNNLLFFGSYPPPFGGIASNLYYLLPELEKKGYNVTSLTFSAHNKIIRNGEMTNIFIYKKLFFLKNMIPIVLLFFKSIKLKNDLSFKFFFRACIESYCIKKTIDEFEIKFIFMYGNELGYPIPILRKIFEVKLIIVYQILGAFYFNPEKYINEKKYFDKVFYNSNLIFSSSLYCSKSAKNLFDFNYDVQVIYTGVDHNEYSQPNFKKQNKSNLKLPKNAFVFFFLGRMIEDMGVDFLIENADRILDIEKNVYLVMAGARGNYSEDVKQLSLEKDRLFYFENIPFEQKIDFYHACDVYLAPTMQKQACMGVSIKEAMACGKPVIASNSGGIPEAVEDGINGYLIPTKNGRLNSDILLDRARNLYNDNLLRTKMGNKGREIVLQKFTNEKTVKRYLEIIAELS